MAEIENQFRLMREEMEELRNENHTLREEVARGKRAATFAPPPQTFAMKRMTRRNLDEEGVTLNDFLKLKTPEYSGEEGDDPQDFLEETEKMVSRLTCSDA